MLSKHNPIQRNQIEMIALDELVPADHLVRKIEAAIDFSFIYDLVKDMYSEVGRPSIDPVILIKLSFIQYTFGIRSMRQTIEELKTNMAYRWFLGYGFHDKVPHFSTFGKNYERRFKDKTPAITSYLFKNDITPAIPYTRPRTKEGYFRKHEYVYDEHFDCYICPADEILKYTTTTKEGYRQYKSDPRICAGCPLLSQCTQSQAHQKLIQRHVWEEHVEEADHLRHHQDVKPIYAKRKETIERVFADAKEKQGMRWTTLRGLKKLSMQAMLTFAAMNLKKMANWTWQGPEMA
ncbi:hypothetical protein AF332_20160 [Sporosarcina globispora]|uniref:Transposase n=1 Tax=Sporosarcina globispora TaxID=1459 RepID=A0A0M0GG90_SPOGL|nr:transposase [Sporosarcina globispora]KON88884.1 hypothetical protein AF332_20160 [Sporosarcina globispora]